MYLYQGRSADTAALLKQPLPQNAGTDLIVRRSLLLAMASARLGDAADSEAALAAAESLHPDGALRAEMLGTEGSVALEQGRLEDAEKLFQNALEIAHRQNEKFFETQMWMNLGVVGLRFEHYEDALERFNRASTLAKSIGARLALEKALGNLGWTYYKTGDSMRALLNAKAAQTEAAAIGATLDEVQWLTNAGRSQFESGDLPAARSSYERSLALAQSLHNSEEILGAHIALSYLLLHQNPQEAVVHIREAERLARLRKNREEELEPLLLEAFFSVVTGQTPVAETQLLNLVKQATLSPRVEWEAENALAELYDKAGRPQDTDLWFGRAIETFHRERLTLQSIELELPFLENGTNLYLGYMEHLIRERRYDDALRVLDNSRAMSLTEGLGASPVHHEGASARPMSARLLASRLHGTILVYSLRPQNSYLWAINANGEEFYTLPGSAAILPLINRHTQSILASKDLLSQSGSTGRQLYDALVKPVANLLKPNSRVFLITDKDLNGLNFETLIPPGDHPHYWIEDVAVTNARSLRLLAASAQQPHRREPSRILLIGDPVYRASEYPTLPHAADEVSDIASHFTPERRSVLTGTQASPDTYFASDTSHFAFIHFVAHATASETNPLDSAIILSRPSNRVADSDATYKLYARDILQQPLHADLVTISSCYGSGMRNYSGEGVVGLVWAFLRAGAHSVIGALWEVSDISTPQLMNNLYTRLLDGSNPDEALRSAKLTMIHGGGVFRKPLYWAPFQLYSGR